MRHALAKKSIQKSKIINKMLHDLRRGMQQQQLMWDLEESLSGLGSLCHSPSGWFLQQQHLAGFPSPLKPSQEEENGLNEGKWRNGLVRPFHAPSWGLTGEPWLAMARPVRDHFGSFDENFFCGLWVMPSTEVPQIAHVGPSLPSFTFCQMPDQCKYTHTHIDRLWWMKFKRGEKVSFFQSKRTCLFYFTASTMTKGNLL